MRSRLAYRLCNSMTLQWTVVSFFFQSLVFAGILFFLFWLVILTRYSFPCGYVADFRVNLFFVPRGRLSVSSLGCFCCCCFLNLFCWDSFYILGVQQSLRGRQCGVCVAVLSGAKGQGCVAVRYITPYFGCIILPPRWLVGGMPCPRKSQKNYTKEKIETDKRRKCFFQHTVDRERAATGWEGLTDATSKDVCVMPRHTRKQRCCQDVGHCLKEKECLGPFVKMNVFFFLLRMRHPFFLLGTPGSFCEFKSFRFFLIQF